MRKLLMIPSLLFGLAACGGSDNPTEPEPTQANISGQYTGVMAGVAQGVAADMDFGLTISQSGKALSGTYAIAGILSDGVDVVNVAGTGTLTGTVGTGNNPSVSIVVKPDACPANTANFSGSYNTANSRITVTGPVQFYDGACTVILTYPTTFILSR